MVCHGLQNALSVFDENMMVSCQGIVCETSRCAFSESSTSSFFLPDAATSRSNTLAFSKVFSNCEVFFFWSEAKKAAFLTFFLKTLEFLFFLGFFWSHHTEDNSPVTRRYFFETIFTQLFLKCSRTVSIHHRFFHQNFCNFIANSTFE